jgi:hypothetical protein
MDRDGHITGAQYELTNAIAPLADELAHTKDREERRRRYRALVRLARGLRLVESAEAELKAPPKMKAPRQRGIAGVNGCRNGNN